MKCINLNATPAKFAGVLAKVKDIFAKKGDTEVTLSLSGGRYDLTAPVELDAAEWSGTKRLRVIGGGRVKPTFSALRDIPAEGFSPVPGKPYFVCRLEREANGEYPNLRTLYVNGKIADIARTSEHRICPAFGEGKERYDPGQCEWGTERDHRIYVPLEAVEEAGVENCRGAELHVRVEWEFKIYHIDHVDPDDTVELDGKTYVAMQMDKSEVKNGNPALRICSRVFFICNTTSVLNTPGQYVYERSCGKLYYYPEGDISACCFGIGGLTNLFDLRNFDSVTMEGLVFTGIEDDILTKTGYYAADQAGWWNAFPEQFPHAGAVRGRNCGRFEIDGCTFTDLPCDGISLVGVLNNVTIRNSRFTRIGATAIRLGRPLAYSETDQINGLRIENNYLDMIGFTYENSCSIIVTKAKGGRINHNTLLRSSYTAISLGWKWDVATWEYGDEVNLENVEVAYNYIKSFLMNMRDGGGIYTLGGNVNVGFASLFNTLHDNYVIEDDLTCPEDGFFGSLYHDGASSNWYTHDNIVVHNPKREGRSVGGSARIYLQTAPPFVGSTEGQAAWHILCENNYVTGCKNFGEVYRSQNFDPEGASNMLDASRHLREMNTHLLKDPGELKKYPDAVRIMQRAGCDTGIGKRK